MFNMASTLRALTTGSPITTALHEARRMARQHLKTGGATKGRPGSSGFVVPSDVDAAALTHAIEAKLRADGNARSGRNSALRKLLERRQDGRLIVPQVVLEQLSGGVADRGT